MEALQQSLRLQAVRGVESGVSSSSGAALARVSSVPARSSLALKVSCASRSSFCHNAVACKVPIAGKAAAGQRALVSMSADTAAGGYASALADLAQSSGTLDKVSDDIDKVASLLEDEQVFDFLVSPVLAEEKKKEVVEKFAKDSRLDQFTLSFLNLLIDKKRINLIREITKEFELIYNDLTNTQAAVVTSAVKIENSQLALIAKKIQSLSGARNVRLKNIIDPSLIAGFIIKYGKDGSSSIDMSVKGQLDRLAAKFEYAERAGSIA